VRKATRSLEQGSGSVVAIGLIASILVLVSVSAIPLGLSLKQARLQVSADNAAIAAADALRGLVAGSPCDVARSFHETVKQCEVIGSDVRLELQSGELTARARAGEP
jgi:secretion/DNA translocation related TadE-like protein